ncbi:MAG: 5'/3'-nucleotidase SurE [Syntrophales bacterium]|jgi:5'-nucleotidase|nr:5'/3'-nucleotidase SurE [Syntrophales bacterium]MCK9527785.1 5'/3'-nucleotidase SurE [Syntrophales bacterium]MDX9922118.1 5'/3'-nucleotidase SurE [Syntrophales bacterium]
MRILLTNDDGVYAEGLSTLCRELSDIGDCLIVAPETEQSAVGHAITIYRPLMVRRARKGGSFLGYAIRGTPADCVKIGVKELSDNPVDLVISGINVGANVGINVLYSGTVSAATEAAVLGIPSIAVSLDTRDHHADFSTAARFMKKLVPLVMEKPFLKKVTLNVNVPNLPWDRIKGVAVTRQGAARLVEEFERRLDPRSNIYYWLAGETLLPETDEMESDACAVRQGFISITPIHFDLTRHNAMAGVREAMEDLVFP